MDRNGLIRVRLLWLYVFKIIFYFEPYACIGDSKTKMKREWGEKAPKMNPNETNEFNK